MRPRPEALQGHWRQQQVQNKTKTNNSCVMIRVSPPTIPSYYIALATGTSSTSSNEHRRNSHHHHGTPSSLKLNRCNYYGVDLAGGAAPRMMM